MDDAIAGNDVSDSGPARHMGAAYV